MDSPRKDNLVAIAFLLSISFLIGLAQTYFRLSAYSICLSEYGARHALYATSLVSVFLPFGGHAYQLLSTRLTFSRVITLAFGVMTLSVVISWLGLCASNSTWFRLLPVFLTDFLSVASGLVFWDLASRVFSDGKGGHFLAIVGAGFPVAGTIGGSTAAMFTRHFPTAHLLLGAIIAMGAGAIAMIVLTRLRTNEVGDAVQRPSTPASSPQDRHVSGKRTTTRILLFCVLSVVACRFLNHLFDDIASSSFSTQAQLTQCLGRIQTLMGIAQLVCMTVVSGKLLKRCGPRVGLLVTPIAVALGSASLWIGWSSAIHLVPLFWIVASTRVLARVLRMSVENPSLMMVYQTYSPAARVRLMATVQAQIQPLANAAGGGFLILIHRATGWGLGVKVLLTLAIALLWCSAAATLSSACCKDTVTESPARKRRQGATPLHTRLQFARNNVRSTCLALGKWLPLFGKVVGIERHR